jgi:hypothetical protein
MSDDRKKDVDEARLVGGLVAAVAVAAFVIKYFGALNGIGR